MLRAVHTDRLAVSCLLAVLGYGCGGQSRNPARLVGASGEAGVQSFAGGGGAVGAGGASGAGGAAPACDGTPLWYADTPLDVAIASATVGGAAGQSGADGEGGPACTIDFVKSTSTLSCLGSVRTTDAGGVAAFEFDDGSVLSWAPTRVRGIPQPELVRGERVWLEYSATQRVVCNVCGAYVGWTLAIRAGQGGDVLWIGRGGEVDELDQATILELFGVTTHREFSCHTLQHDCASADADLFDQVLETDPEQRLPYGVLTRVDTPHGSFDVVSATATLLGNAGACSDSLPPYGGRDFAASRVAE